jgi:hypothetical protein
MIHRMIATARANFVDLEDHHFPCWGTDAKPAAVTAAEICKRNGWILLDVQPETDAHNVPKLAPLRWARREAHLRELTRRMGG